MGNQTSFLNGTRRNKRGGKRCVASQKHASVQQVTGWARPNTSHAKYEEQKGVHDDDDDDDDEDDDEEEEEEEEEEEDDVDVDVDVDVEEEEKEDRWRRFQWVISEGSAASDSWTLHRTLSQLVQIVIRFYKNSVSAWTFEKWRVQT